MPLITYADKVQLNNNPDIPDNQKCRAKDMNEIKKAINDLIRPVGSYYETSDTSFDPNVTWGGTWELETDGTVLVSKSTTSGSKFNVDVGTVIGEETHKLTIDEMPSHTHGVAIAIKNTVSGGARYYFNPVGTTSAPITDTGAWSNSLTAKASGGGQAHNNIQPSKIINRWHRTA